MIEADQLTVNRLARVVLREVSLRIGHGEVVSIIGPNGAGKSTLMAALVGLLPAVSGRVRLDGQLITDLPRKQIARRLAYVPQNHEGYEGFTVRDILESARYAHLEPLASLGEQDRDAIDRAARSCRITGLFDRTIDTLSGGERQKVWLSAALAQDCPSLLLDEPTTALDPAHQAELIRIMRDYHDRGNTLVVICHDLNLPISLGGRVIALRDQQIAFNGPVEALIDPARLRELFETDFVLHRSEDESRVSIQLRV